MNEILLTDSTVLPNLLHVTKGASKRIQADLPLTKGMPPAFLLHEGKLYRYRGEGMTAYFYHSVPETFHNLDSK
jgi:hypothetical protein